MRSKKSAAAVSTRGTRRRPAASTGWRGPSRGSRLEGRARRAGCRRPSPSLRARPPRPAVQPPPMASMATLLIPSRRLGTTTTSAAASKSGTSLRAPRKDTTWASPELGSALLEADRRSPSPPSDQHTSGPCPRVRAACTVAPGAGPAPWAARAGRPRRRAARPVGQSQRRNGPCARRAPAVPVTPRAPLSLPRGMTVMRPLGMTSRRDMTSATCLETACQWSTARALATSAACAAATRRLLQPAAAK